MFWIGFGVGILVAVGIVALVIALIGRNPPNFLPW